MHLQDVHSPQDIKKLSQEELEHLAGEIREKLISTVSQRGGHLASNLGVVELTLALHRVLNTPQDKIVFDVGHQSYVHKLLTGRYAKFDTLRGFGGLSGFPKRSESPYDTFDTGHASTALSAAVGMCRARDFLHEDYHVVAVVGDGAMTGGMCYEALNDAGSIGTRMIVILNDNEMSIAPNVGALQKHLTDLRVSKGWQSTKKAVRNRLTSVPLLGRPLYRAVHWGKELIKNMFVDEGFFGSLGFHYFGPISGHDIPQLEKTLRRAMAYEEPCVIHVLTTKGCGYEKAEQKPEAFHGTPPFYVETGDAKKVSSTPSYGKIMAQELAEMAKSDPRIVAVTAAMPSGTGLNVFEQRCPGRLIDVGIAQEHAVTMSAGMAAGGLKPYFAVYTSFFQRSYDQMIHDVCMQGLPVTFLLDRAGLVGQDGATHHGIYDFAQLLPVTGMTVLAPRDIHELKQMIRWTGDWQQPVAIRYGRSSVDQSERYPYGTFKMGRWETLEKGKDCVILAVGSMVREAIEAHDVLLQEGIEAEVVNCSTVKPLDEKLLNEIGDRPMITMQEHALTGGFGAEICRWCTAEEKRGPIVCFGISDTFVQHGRRQQLLRFLGLTGSQMAVRIKTLLKEKNTDE